MTSCHELFNTYSPCFGSFKIRIIDGSLSWVARKGIIKLQNLTLNSILHVPKLTGDLVSINKLTKDLNCAARFSPMCFEF